MDTNTMSAKSPAKASITDAVTTTLTHGLPANNNNGTDCRSASSVSPVHLPKATVVSKASPVQHPKCPKTYNNLVGIIRKYLPSSSALREACDKLPRYLCSPILKPLSIDFLLSPEGRDGRRDEMQLRKLEYTFDMPNASHRGLTIGSRVDGWCHLRRDAPNGDILPPESHTDLTVRPTRRAREAIESFCVVLRQWCKDSGQGSDEDGSAILKGRSIFAFDCEMVDGEYPRNVNSSRRVSLLARATIVHIPSGIILIDQIVKPRERIFDYVTRFSGITPDMMDGSASDVSEDDMGDHSVASAQKCRRSNGNSLNSLWRLEDIQSVFQLLLDSNSSHNTSSSSGGIGGADGVIDGCSDVYIIGHGMDSDFTSCRILAGAAPKEGVKEGLSINATRGSSTLRIIDTVDVYPHPRGLPVKNKLSWLVDKYLHRAIQKANHDSLEDAAVCAELVLLLLVRGTPPRTWAY